MTKKLKVWQAGRSVAVTLPKDMVDRLHLGAGDVVFAVETECGILVTPSDPTVEEALAIAERTATKYRHALRKLAK